MSEPYIKVPLHAVEHYYLHTKPIAGLDPMLPGNYLVLNLFTFAPHSHITLISQIERKICDPIKSCSHLKFLDFLIY